MDGKRLWTSYQVGTSQVHSPPGQVDLWLASCRRLPYPLKGRQQGWVVSAPGPRPQGSSWSGRPPNALTTFSSQEGANINKSLTTLGKVISALAEMVS